MAARHRHVCDARSLVAGPPKGPVDGSLGLPPSRQGATLDSTPVPTERPSSPDRRRLLIALGYGAANLAALSRWLRSGGNGGSQGETLAEAASARSPAGGGPSMVPSATDAPVQPADHIYDVVISGGRVIDCETGYDHVANVGIDGPTIAAISTAPLKGHRGIGAAGKVVSAGFIDLLSYEPDDYDARYKIADGVTTNLGMHGINTRSVDFFKKYEGNCVVHFGGAFDDPWVRSSMFEIQPGEAASPTQIGQLVDECENQLRDGWIGVDFEPEYTPGIRFDEMKALAEVAKRHDVPCFSTGASLRWARTLPRSMRSSRWRSRPGPRSTSST